MLILMTVLLTAPWTALQAQNAERTGRIGEKVGNLTFKDIRYLPRSLDDFKDKKAFVLAFTNTTCPLVQRYWPTLKELETAYRVRGVQFLAVNVGADDAIIDMAAQAVEHGVPFPVVKDSDGKCVKALGVERTPEVAVLDAERRLRYRGRIDDQYRLGGTRATPSRQDLKEALDAVLAGKEVAVRETPVDGCLITLPASKAAGETVTYAQDVAPILIKHCQECHRPGTAAPFSLITYEQAAAKANTIAEVVGDRSMPPWYGTHAKNEFFNHRGLSAKERDTIIEWARNGKAKGDLAKAPPSPYKEEPQPLAWRIPEPDLTLKVVEHELPASGDIPYKYVILPHIFAEDTWVQAIEMRPDNPRVLHHCNMAFMVPPERFKLTNFITGTVPGSDPMNLEEGIGFRIPKGAVLGLQIHYVSTGKPEKCRLTVGVRYARGVIQKQLRFHLLEDVTYAIPPGEPFHPVKAERTLDRDVNGVALFSHMHLRGKDMSFRAHHPDGKSETLLIVPNYNFDWQMVYRWEPGKRKFLKGTRLECLAHYDNSPFNPYNPDPTATVRDGLQTHQEMMNGFFFYVDANEQLNLKIDAKTGRVVK
jgi:thiol-disulfide isomerase/thioredoxin